MARENRKDVPSLPELPSYGGHLLERSRAASTTAQPSARRRQPEADDHIVLIVDDDPRVCEALRNILASLGTKSETFGSAAEYIDFPRPDLPACLLLDIGLPDINGLDLQGMLVDGRHPPIVFISGRGDIPSSVRAMKAGAVDFLTKPIKDRQLTESIQTALELDRKARQERAKLAELEERLARLSRRERDVLPLVVSGLLNKQAAAELGISEITFQIHRGRVMRKMDATSLAELVRMAVSLGVPFIPGSRS